MLSYSTHARERMEEREITEDEVINALKRTTGPPQPGDRGNIVVYGYGRGSRILKIVLTSDRQTVVSVVPVGK